MGERPVLVRFINAETGAILFERTMMLAQLPSSFETATTFHFDEEPWQVVKAIPATAQEFTRTGKLLVAVKRMKIKTMSPQDILFTLPTLCHDLPVPQTDNTKLDQSVYEMHEDDWRQIEFISTSLSAAIEAELAEIAQIYREQRGEHGSGFKTLHIRRRISEPIHTKLTLSQVQRAFQGIEHLYDGVGFFGYPGHIEGGFALKSGSIVCYGQQSGGLVRTCGLAFKDNTFAQRIPERTADLAHLMIEHSLCLVDWCRIKVMDAPMIDVYFGAIDDEMRREGEG